MTFGIAGNTEKPEIIPIAAAIIRRFRNDRVPFIVHQGLLDLLRKRLGWRTMKGVTAVSERKLGSRCDMLVTLGGDGTMLRMSRLVSTEGTPILGVNLGRVGFLAETSVDELDEVLGDVIAGRYTVEERLMLESWIEGGAKHFIALNDIVVDLSVSSRMFPVEVSVNGQLVSTFTGDGVIVSTPTGSTGYALSNGGPILVPTTVAIMISPICPHALTARPIVIPDDSIVRLNVKAAPGKVHVTADGQQQYAIRGPVSVVVQKAKVRTKVVKRLNLSYYDVLRRKLHWGRDVRSPLM
jgi:NAD+ kinase